MKKFFFVILIIFFKIEIAFSQGYGDQFISLKGCGYGFSAYINLQNKTLDLNGDGIYNGRYKIKFENRNFIETRGKYFDSSYPIFKVTKRTGIIKQLNSKASSKVYCTEVNRELTDYGLKIAKQKKEKERKEAEKNKPKIVAKKPNSKWNFIENSVWRFGNQYYVLFLKNECKVHVTASQHGQLFIERDLNELYGKYRNNLWGFSNCSFEKKNDYVKMSLQVPKRESMRFYVIFKDVSAMGSSVEGGISRFERMKKNSYPPNIRGVKIKIDPGFQAELDSKSGKVRTVVKKPEKKPDKVVTKEKEKTKIVKSPEIDKSLITIGSGSGFYINNKGYALTNNHVIDICKQSIAVIDGEETLFRVIATDKTNDVAVLKTNYKSRNFIKINEDGAKLGENVIAVGYPLAGRLSDSVKITKGIVSSLSGLNNNIGQIQIDAALQPGNSGGPVLNENGELVGIASAGLNKLLMAKEAKYIPENVNFAVASPIVVNILKSKKVKYAKPSLFSGSFSNTELAELGDRSTIQLFCRNTRAEYARLKKSKKYSQILLDID